MSWDAETRRVLSGLEKLCLPLQNVCSLCDKENSSPAALKFSKEIGQVLSEVRSAIDGVFSMCAVLEDEADMEMRQFSSRAVFTVLLQQCAQFFGEVGKSATVAEHSFKLEGKKMGAQSKPGLTTSTVAPPVVKLGTPKESSDESSEVESEDNDPPPIQKSVPPQVEKKPVLAVKSSAVAQFLTVSESLVDKALGPVVMTARPRLLSSLDSLLFDGSGGMSLPKLHYVLADGGTLESVAVTCFNSENPDERVAEAQSDATLDLLCDAIRDEDVEVTPLTGASGPVSFASRSLPSVSWRVASTIGEEVSLQTFLCFCDVPRIGKCLLIQDKLSTGDETLHVLREQANSHIDVMCISGTAKGHDTIGSLYKRFFGVFFKVDEIKESDDAAMSAMAAASKLREKHTQDRKNQGSQKLEVEEAEPQGGIIGVGKSIVKMPLNIGKGVVESIGSVSQEAVFKKNFPELVDEELIAYFNCAWKQDGSPIIKQGFLYATKHHLCFQGTVLAATFKLQYDEIVNMTKKKSIGVLNNSIQIETIDDEKYFLTSFLSRDEAFKALYAAWTKSES